MTIRHVHTNQLADDPDATLVRPSDWNSAHAYTLQDAVSLAGNTAGMMTLINSGTLVVAGGNNITLSQNGNSVTVSGPHVSNFLTTAMASNRGSDFVAATAAFAGTNATGTIASNGISVSVAAPVGFAAKGSGAYTQNTGTIDFANSNGVTFGLSTNVMTASVRTDYAGLNSSSSSTAGTDIKFALNTNGVTLSVPAYLTTAQAPGAYLTTARASTDAIGLNTAQTNVTWTVNSSGLSFNANGYAGTGLTTTTTAGTAIVGTNNTAGLSLNYPAFLTTAALLNHSHGNPTLNLTNLSGTTASASNGFTLSLSAAAAGGGAAISADANSQNTGTVNFSASNGVTFGLSNNGVMTATVKTDYLTTQSNQTVGLYAVSNTAGALSSYTYDARTISIRGAGGISVGNITGGGSTEFMVSGIVAPGTGFTSTTTAGVDIKATLTTNGLSMAVPALLTTAALSNHSHGNPTLNLTNLSGTTASASNGFTLSLSAAAPGAGGGATVSYQEIMDGARMTTCALWNNATYSNRAIFLPFRLGDALAGVHTVRILASRTGGTVLVATMFAGLYSLANSTSMNLISSTSRNFSVSTSAQYSGIRIYDIAGLSALSLSQGNYVLGLQMSIAATNSGGLNLMGGDGFVNAGFVLPGTDSTAASHSQSHIFPMWGVFNATSAGLPSAVAKSSISGGASQNSPDVYTIVGAI